MVSIVIPLGTGSRWNNTELRYAFRSVEKHLVGYGDIFIIGEKPDWLQDIIHIPATDIEQTWAKERNIYNKIMLACEDERVTDDFLFMNDDHFLLQDFEISKFPYYWDGMVRDKLTITQYKNTVANTLDWFMQKSYKYFDVHSPIVYSKKQFRESVGELDWTVKWGYCIKTMFCLLNVVEGVQYPDLKINQSLSYGEIIHLIANRPWFSMGDAARQGDMLQVLEDLYPNQSRYEK